MNTVKHPLYSILKDPNKFLPVIRKAVDNCHLAVILAYQLIRLTLLQLYHQDPLRLPKKISPQYCGYALSIVSNSPVEISIKGGQPPKADKRATKGGGKQSPDFKALQSCYDTDFKNTIPPSMQVQGEGLSSIFQSLSQEMSVAYQNNISVHYLKRLKKVIKHLLLQKFPEKVAGLKKKQLWTTCDKIYQGLNLRDISEVPESLREVYQICLQRYVPEKIVEESLEEDIEEDWMNYLVPTLRINSDFEAWGDCKLFQPFSLRTSAIPGYIPINSKNLAYLIDREEFEAKMGVSKSAFLANLSDEGSQYLLWSTYFKVDKKVFKYGKSGKAKFYYRICTDGFGASISFCLPERYETSKMYRHIHLPEEVKEEREAASKQRRAQIAKEKRILKSRSTNPVPAGNESGPKLVINPPCLTENARQALIAETDRYLFQTPEVKRLTDLSPYCLEQLKTKTIVGVDPGCFNLVQMISYGPENDETCDRSKWTKFRYTRKERDHQTSQTKCSKIKAKMAKTNNCQVILSNGELTVTNVKHLEDSLKAYNSKTMNIEKFKAYIKAKNLVYSQVQSHYRNILFRKMDYRVKIRRRQSEHRLVNEVKKRFDPEKTILAYGDWSRPSGFRGGPSTPGIGLRKLLSKVYPTFLVDEFKTSKTCSYCGSDVEHRERDDFNRSHKCSKGGRSIYRCLVCKECQNPKGSIGVRYISRDINGARNIWVIARERIWMGRRPDHLSRGGGDSDRESLLTFRSQSIDGYIYRRHRSESTSKMICLGRIKKLEE